MELTVVPLRKLSPGTRFRRPTGEHVYIVSADRDEQCGNINVFCYNLTNGSKYWWDGNTRVVPLASGAFPAPGFPAPGRVEYPAPERSRRFTPFWMCVVEGGGNPTMKHFFEQKARMEAERLVKLTGKPVLLLEAVDRVSFRPVVVSTELVWEKL